MDYVDPGWRPFARAVALSPTASAPGTAPETSALAGARSTFLAALGVQGIVLLVHLLIASEFTPRRGIAVALVPLAVGAVASWAGIWWLRRRPLSTASPETLARSYVRAFVPALGLAQAPALLGLTAMYVMGKLSLLVFGVLASLVGLALVAPTTREIARRQARVVRTGSSISVGAALASTPFRTADGLPWGPRA